MYVDVEEMLVGYLQPLSPLNVAVEMPNLPTLPFILVGRVSGGDDLIVESAIVEISVFHNTRSLSAAAARQMHSLMQQLKPTTLTLSAGGNSVRVDRCMTIHGPSWVPYRDENLRRYLARYVIESRVTSQS